MRHVCIQIDYLKYLAFLYYIFSTKNIDEKRTDLKVEILCFKAFLSN